MENEQSYQIDPARLESLLSRIGVAVLSMAAVLTIVELDHARAKAHAEVKQATATHHPVELTPGEQKQYMRKDKEKTQHMTHSFGVMMRSHPTAGEV